MSVETAILHLTTMVSVLYRWMLCVCVVVPIN